MAKLPIPTMNHERWFEPRTIEILRSALTPRSEAKDDDVIALYGKCHLSKSHVQVGPFTTAVLQGPGQAMTRWLQILDLSDEMRRAIAFASVAASSALFLEELARQQHAMRIRLDTDEFNIILTPDYVMFASQAFYDEVTITRSTPPSENWLASRVNLAHPRPRSAHHGIEITASLQGAAALYPFELPALTSGEELHLISPQVAAMSSP